MESTTRHESVGASWFRMKSINFGEEERDPGPGQRRISRGPSRLQPCTALVVAASELSRGLLPPWTDRGESARGGCGTRGGQRPSTAASSESAPRSALQRQERGGAHLHLALRKWHHLRTLLCSCSWCDATGRCSCCGRAGGVRCDVRPWAPA
ncbi:hypothetical protein GUJ93_ZPchr0003g16745 [Zizania palustris]|uniref:Uncharacterized protein n=1 Tax=Zizania palustris TaxID=103762 RepID=A0A8J5SGI0_ZIZPA|nr:hypothetical protein GUJ93_ZPchr0003g16745 [Zizania palustris]